jgi:hypothetical protein
MVLPALSTDAMLITDYESITTGLSTGLRFSQNEALVLLANCETVIVLPVESTVQVGLLLKAVRLLEQLSTALAFTTRSWLTVLLHRVGTDSISEPPTTIGLPGVSCNVAVPTVLRVFGEKVIEQAMLALNFTFELSGAEPGNPGGCRFERGSCTA